MKLEHSLVLNRWLHAQLGAREVADLKGDLMQPEPGVAGESPFLGALLERPGVRLDDADLRGREPQRPHSRTEPSEKPGAVQITFVIWGRPDLPRMDA